MLHIYNNKWLKQLKSPGIFNVFIGTPFSFTKKVHEIVLVWQCMTIQEMN
jgi:hypothetical protein